MANNLVFPIKFDLEAAVREAQGDADRLLRRLQTTINAKPLAVNLKIPGAGSGSINEINSRLKELVKQWNNLTEAQRITNKTTGEYTAEAKKILAEYTRLRGASESYAQSLKQIDSAAKKAAKQQEKLAEAAYRGSNAFKNQDGYVSRLVKRLAVYASFQYTSQFLTNIREVTAQFELQRISLGAIIQDQQKANQIFAEIKSFALTSPLKILDLTKYTKQVAAYGFETEKLFDTTKMLADISAGLGVDFGRTVLAYSQVLTTGFLRASEARQMTEQGIPIVDKLAKKLTELNGRIYTAAEVMDMMSKRAISFELVEQVFRDMTSAGGEFYNMQVKQSQTLFGMWSKLGDAAAIMYDQIGNTSSINAGMKLAIRSIESMMRNWKTTARVLDSVAVAMTVYIVGLKNAAVASKALTSAVALENLAHQQQIIRTPKVVAGIIGINNAKKISTLLTGLHTKAVLGEAAATNVLTKGFWKLTAAMLANPWVAAAAGVALVVTALIHFIGNTETAAERAEKLNNSVASLKNLEDSTKPLIDTYNELINKTERTAEEQKKLSEVTHELAKQYPGAITAIGNFGEEVELAADKLNQLYQAEKQARMENTRHELEKTEQKITETEEKIARLQAQLQDGTKTVTVGSSITGYTQTVTVQMSDEDKGKILKQIDELRYGEDGQSGLFGLQQSAEAARRALGLLPSEAAQAVEKFGAWKKTFTTFRKQVGDVRVQLFDDSTIAQFGSLEEALKKTAEEYKKNIALVATYDETLKSATLTSEERAKIETERAEADTMANLAEKALKYYNAMSLLNTSTSGRSRGGAKSDNRLQNLQEIEQTLTKINQKYNELAKKEGQTKALEDINNLYANTLQYINKLGKQFKLSFKMPTEFKDLQDYRKAILDVINTLKMKGYQKAALDLEEKIGTGNLDALQKDIERQLKALADRISRTKTAKEFYEKILGMTGDVELAANVAIHVYGEQGKDLNKQIREQIEKLLEPSGIKIDESIFREDGTFDPKKLRDFAEAQKDALGGIESKAYQELIKLSDNADKDFAKTIEGWLKAIEKAKSASDKMLDLARTTRTEIDKITAQKGYAQTRIIELLGLGTRTDEQQQELENLQGFLDVADKLIQGFKDKQAKEQTSLAYEMFKDSPMYVQMFDDLDHASTAMLENMKTRIEGLKGAWKDLTPTQLKELQSRMNEIDAQLAKRNPFKTLAKSISDYRKLRREGDSRGNKSEGAANADLIAASKAADEARKKYDELVKKYGEGSEKSVQEVIDAKDKLDRAMANEEAAQKAVENWKKVKDMIGLSANELFQMLNWAGDIAKGIADISEAMGADEEDVQYWNDVADALGEISGGIQDIVQSAMSGNVVGIISSTLTAIPKMFVGFANLFSAGKIKRANKEIKRQAELLEQLEYTYGRLEAAADKLFGRDYVNNYNQQLKNLQAQQQAYLKQAEAERSKGKKKDKEKIKEYEEQARETADKIKELQDDLVAHFTGSTKTDVARQMAKSWIDARASMSDTFAAIKGDYQDLIKNMIVEGAAARVIENALSKVWDDMDAMLKKNDVQGAIDSLVNGMDSALSQANNGMEVLWKALEARGYDMKQLIGDTDSEYTGIAKSVAGATSEEINNVAAIGNTLMYYVSPIPRIDENLARAVALMEGRGASAIPQTASAGWTDWQQQAMDNYIAIQRNTADTVVECRRAAEACERIASTFKVKGSTKGLNVFLNS